MYGLQFGFAMLSDTNSSNADELDFGKMLGLPFEFKMIQGDLIGWSTFMMSLQYNISNFYVGY